jgi:hypothetical protein
MPEQVDQSRVAAWNEVYRQSTPDEQKSMDQMVKDLIVKMKARGARQFGPDMAKELIVAVLQYRGRYHPYLVIDDCGGQNDLRRPH